MKKKYRIVVLLTLTLLTLFSTQANGKKLKFGEYIVYKGKVINEEPVGEGVLTIAHPNGKQMKAAICTGIFEGWLVTGSINFYSEGNYPSYLGQARLSINPDGSSIKFDLTLGTYKDQEHEDGIMITKDNPLTIICSLKDDIELSSSKIPLTKQVTKAEYGNFSPLNMERISTKLGNGNPPRITRHSACEYQGTALKEISFYETIDYGQGMEVKLDGKTVQVAFNNNDNYSYRPGVLAPIMFTKTYSDGVISLRENAKVIRSNNQGIAAIPSSANDMEIMLTANTLAESRLKFYYGELGTLFEKAQSGDAQASMLFKEKVTLLALEQVKADRRKKQVGAELMEIGNAYHSGNLNVGDLYSVLEEKGALTDEITASNDSALTWMRMAATIDESYQGNVVELEKEMGIYEEPENEVSETNEASEEDIMALLKPDTRKVSAIMSEAKSMTHGGDFIDEEYKITVPIFAFASDNFQNNQSLVGLGCKATLEVIPFGADGNTALLELDFNGHAPNITLSWSGRNVHMGPGTVNGEDMLVVINGNTPCGGLAATQGVWAAWLHTSEGGITNSDIKRGMTRSEVERLVTTLKLSKFKFSRKVGNLDVYTLYWLRQEDKYDYAKGAYVGELKNDKRFGDFYFDSKGKLVKWIIVY